MDPKHWNNIIENPDDKKVNEYSLLPPRSHSMTMLDLMRLRNLGLGR